VTTDRSLTCNFYDLQPVQATIFNIAEKMQVMIHSPLDVPTVWDLEGIVGTDDTGSTDLYLYPASIEVLVADDFEKYVIHNCPIELSCPVILSLSSTHIEQRHCRFPYESNLTYFPIYTYNLCRQDCRIKKFLELCGCIPFFYVSDLTAKLPVCGPSDFGCLKEFISKEVILQGKVKLKMMTLKF
jgi:Amiloride-sensitive sodium channel